MISKAPSLFQRSEMFQGAGINNTQPSSIALNILLHRTPSHSSHKNQPKMFVEISRVAAGGELESLRAEIISLPNVYEYNVELHGGQRQQQ